MTQEAMKLALKALENSVDLVREDAYQAEKLYGNYPTRQGKVNGLKVLADDHEKAITALRQALANEALDKMAENARELGLDYEPEQEPVAWPWLIPSPLEQPEPVHHAVIAGALFDFMGWLTSRKERIVLSGADEAGPAVDAIRDFAKMRGLSLDDAKVQDWQDMARGSNAP